MSTPPEAFGKYQLIERIATGGMAEIYRGKLEAGHGVTKPVVIKKILPHYGQQRTFVRMFINEAKIAVGMSHGNIAQVFDFGEIGGEYYLAMELVDGQPLSRVLRKAKSKEMPALPPPFAAQVAIEICKGLHYAHTRLDERGRPLAIVHRDVSPQNILISYEGQVKLVDFGIAKARNASVDSTTETGAVKGKYVYFAPEQARGKELDARTDVFATGIVLYEMLAGRLPFEGKMMEVLKKIVTGSLVRPSEVNPAVPATLEAIILRAMSTEKRARQQTAQALQDELSQWLYANAPTYSFSALGHLMSYLFEEELIEDGLPVQIPPDFRARLADWRGPPPEPDASVARGAARDPRLPSGDRPPAPKAPAPLPAVKPVERTAELPPALTLSTVFPRLPVKWLFWGLPLLAALAAGLVVFAVGYFGGADVQLTSNPPGALVVVDGKPAPSVTPVLITGLDPDAPHVLQVQAPGRKVWSE
ncbi:MAG TPA: serine/threonine-protein kinase, partial [Myxococcales bacterium]|nr:serine/threonine-protein kinase [Myxococcales bacterium]